MTYLYSTTVVSMFSWYAISLVFLLFARSLMEKKVMVLLSDFSSEVIIKDEEGSTALKDYMQLCLGHKYSSAFRFSFWGLSRSECERKVKNLDIWKFTYLHCGGEMKLEDPRS